MGLQAQSGAHSRHAIAIHLVWVVKYRRSVLTREVGDRCNEIVREVAAEIGVEIVSIESEVNHVHVVARLKPTHTVAGVVKRFKGRSAHKLFREYPWLRKRLWGGHLWQPSYYAASVGGASLETIKKYVEGQRSKYH